MGSKPKKQDYKPSEADKANAAVAQASLIFLNKTMILFSEKLEIDH